MGGSSGFNSGESTAVNFNPSKGDILEFDRGEIFHYALYIGNDLVMDIPGDKNATRMKPTRRNIQDVCGSSPVRVCNMENEARSRNLFPRDVSDIIASAEEDEKQGELIYNLFQENCEYYVTKWRYGQGFSIQAENPILNTPCGNKVICLGAGAVGFGMLYATFKRYKKHHKSLKRMGASNTKSSKKGTRG